MPRKKSGSEIFELIKERIMINSDDLPHNQDEWWNNFNVIKQELNILNEIRDVYNLYGLYWNKNKGAIAVKVEALLKRDKQ